MTAHPGASTEISGGVSHIDYHSANSLKVKGSILPLDPTNPALVDGQDAKKWIYSASLKHNFTPNLMVYVGTGSSWRPGINAVGDFCLNKSALERSFLNLPAESSKSYEAGIKSTMLGGKLTANLSGRARASAKRTIRWARSRTAPFHATTSTRTARLTSLPAHPALPSCRPWSVSACQVSQRSAFQSPFSATITSEYQFAVSDHVNGYLCGLLNYDGSSQADPINIYD